MALSQMQVFNEFYHDPIIETVAQRIDVFNQASGGAIVLNADNFQGDFLRSSFFTSLSTARRRVDRYGANSAVTAIDLAEQQRSAVKVAGGFGPIRFEPSQMTWLERPTAEAIEAISSQFADLLLQDQLNAAIASAVAAIENNANARHDISATAGLDYSAINTSHSLFGDMSNLLVAEVMTGAVYHKFIGLNLTNANHLFDYNGVRVVDILGKRVVVTDAPALYAAGSPNKNKVLSLAQGGIVVGGGSSPIFNVETRNGNQRIETTFQVDYDFNLSLKGYSWDEANGGKSPTDAELGTGSNWDVSAGNVKFTAGVIAIGDAAK